MMHTLPDKIPQRSGLFASLEVDFAGQDCATNKHRYDDDGQVDPRELQPSNVNMLPSQDVPPQQPCKRCTEGGAEGAVVDANSHTVYRSPKRTVANWNTAFDMDFSPGLNQARQENCRADISPSELQ
jgi:hypothetical protein